MSSYRARRERVPVSALVAGIKERQTQRQLDQSMRDMVAPVRDALTPTSTEDPATRLAPLNQQQHGSGSSNGAASASASSAAAVAAAGGDGSPEVPHVESKSAAAVRRQLEQHQRSLQFLKQFPAVAVNKAREQQQQQQVQRTASSSSNGGVARVDDVDVTFDESIRPVRQMGAGSSDPRAVTQRVAQRAADRQSRFLPRSGSSASSGSAAASSGAGDHAVRRVASLTGRQLLASLDADGDGDGDEAGQAVDDDNSNDTDNGSSTRTATRDGGGVSEYEKQMLALQQQQQQQLQQLLQQQLAQQQQWQQQQERDYAAREEQQKQQRQDMEAQLRRLEEERQRHVAEEQRQKEQQQQQQQRQHEAEEHEQEQEERRRTAQRQSELEVKHEQLQQELDQQKAQHEQQLQELIRHHKEEQAQWQRQQEEATKRVVTQMQEQLQQQQEQLQEATAAAASTAHQAKDKEEEREDDDVHGSSTATKAAPLADDDDTRAKSSAAPPPAGGVALPAPIPMFAPEAKHAEHSDADTTAASVDVEAAPASSALHHFMRPSPGQHRHDPKATRPHFALTDTTPSATPEKGQQPHEQEQGQEKGKGKGKEVSQQAHAPFRVRSAQSENSGHTLPSIDEDQDVPPEELERMSSGSSTRLGVSQSLGSAMKVTISAASHSTDNSTGTSTGTGTGTGSGAGAGAGMGADLGPTSASRSSSVSPLTKGKRSQWDDMKGRHARSRTALVVNSSHQRTHSMRMANRSNMFHIDVRDLVNTVQSRWQKTLGAIKLQQRRKKRQQQRIRSALDRIYHPDEVESLLHKMFERLHKGNMFLRYRANGKPPHLVRVWITRDMAMVRWAEPDKPPCSNDFLRVQDLGRVLKDCVTEVFRENIKSKKLRLEADTVIKHGPNLDLELDQAKSRCFSLEVLKFKESASAYGTTLDLQVVDGNRDSWLRMFDLLLRLQTDPNLKDQLQELQCFINEDPSSPEYTQSHSLLSLHSHGTHGPDSQTEEEDDDEKKGASSANTSLRKLWSVVDTAVALKRANSLKESAVQKQLEEHKAEDQAEQQQQEAEQKGSDPSSETTGSEVTPQIQVHDEHDHKSQVVSTPAPEQQREPHTQSNSSEDTKTTAATAAGAEAAEAADTKQNMSADSPPNSARYTDEEEFERPQLTKPHSERTFGGARPKAQSVLVQSSSEHNVVSASSMFPSARSSSSSILNIAGDAVPTGPANANGANASQKKDPGMAARRLLDRAIRLFNLKPKQGVAFAKKNGLFAPLEFPIDPPEHVLQSAAEEAEKRARGRARRHAARARAAAAAIAKAEKEHAESAAKDISVTTQGRADARRALEMERQRHLEEQERKDEEEAAAEAAIDVHALWRAAAPVAAWLICLMGRGLDRVAVGRYLGNEKNIWVLRAYLHMCDFSGLNLTGALRFVFRGFKPEGEAQVIDRVLGEFALAFFAQQAHSSLHRYTQSDSMETVSPLGALALASPRHEDDDDRLSMESMQELKLDAKEETHAHTPGNPAAAVDSSISASTAGGVGAPMRTHTNAQHARFVHSNTMALAHPATSPHNTRHAITPNAVGALAGHVPDRAATIMNHISPAATLHASRSGPAVSLLQDTAVADLRTDDNKFDSSDNVFLVSFMVLMLNTDLHSNEIKAKMSLEQFIENCRRADKDLPEEYLQKLYTSVLVEPIRMEKNEGDLGTLFVEAAYKGWLYIWEPAVYHERPRDGSRAPARTDLVLRRSWAVLTEGCLYLFSDHDSTQPRLIITLEEVRCVALKSARPFKPVPAPRLPSAEDLLLQHQLRQQAAQVAMQRRLTEAKQGALPMASGRIAQAVAAAKKKKEEEEQQRLAKEKEEREAQEQKQREARRAEEEEKRKRQAARQNGDEADEDDAHAAAEETDTVSPLQPSGSRTSLKSDGSAHHHRKRSHDHKCASCGAPGALMRCKGCNTDPLTHYCNRACQAQDWQGGGHWKLHLPEAQRDSSESKSSTMRPAKPIGRDVLRTGGTCAACSPKVALDDVVHTSYAFQLRPKAPPAGLSPRAHNSLVKGSAVGCVKVAAWHVRSKEGSAGIRGGPLDVSHWEPITIEVEIESEVGRWVRAINKIAKTMSASH